MSVLESLALRRNFATHRVTRMPVLVLMPHSRCNCRCLMCDIWRANKNLKELSAETVARHVDDFDALGVRWIVLSGGEALMHSNLWQLCAGLQRLEARITLLSTGLLLEKNVAAIAEWIDEVILSLDGSPAVHDRIRNVPRAFEKLHRGVAALRRGAPDVTVGARCVLQSENYDDFVNIVDTARALKLDWVSFLAADVSSEAFNRPGGWDESKQADVRLTPNECDELERILQASFDRFPEAYSTNFIVEAPAKLLQLVQYFRAMNGDAEFPEQQCTAPWVSSVIETDGQVRPCFFHPPYGRLADDDLVSLINSPRAVAFRKELDVNHNPVCQRCVCSLNLR